MNFVAFLVYFTVFFLAFIFRPYSNELRHGTTTINWYCLGTPESGLGNSDFSVSENITDILMGIGEEENETLAVGDSLYGDSITSGIRNYYCDAGCNLLHIRDQYDLLRMVAETVTVIGVVVYMTMAVLQIRRLGWKKYYRTLQTFPAKLIFHFSFIFILMMIPLRAACFETAEHIVGILAMLTTSFHFLFFCRGIKFIGPFVLVVYKIISGDMIRFFIIYGILVIGFSQSFFIIFLGCNRHSEEATEGLLDALNGTNNNSLTNPVIENILAKPHEAIIRMFIMSIGEFGMLYKQMHGCNQHILGKVMFIVFELGVSIMLLNLLIAMMARTYQEIVETQKEWKRQWAKVILMLEETLKPNERLLALLKYSRPIGTNKNNRAFVVKYHQSEEEARMEKEKKQKEWKEFMEGITHKLDEQLVKHEVSEFSMEWNLNVELSKKRAQYKRKLHGDMMNSRSVSRADGIMTRMGDMHILPNMLNRSLKN